MLIDTHAHLNFPELEKNLDQVIKRTLAADVKKIICVGSNLADSTKAIAIAKKYPGIVYAAVGIHPQHQPKASPLLIEKLNKLANLDGVVAIGECGLDYNPAPPGEKDRPKKEQKFLFTEQLKLAQKLNLPVIVHTRQAFEDTVKYLNRFKGLKGVFHCYSAGKKGISQVDKLGFYFGVDGNLTYDEGLQNVFAQIPLEKILLETDAPFLTPEPHRGQTNEPKNVRLVAECLAKIKKISLTKVSQVTTKNAEKLFTPRNTSHTSGC